MILDSTIILGIIAIPFLLKGADIIVKHGQSIARHVGISEFFIGLTILSIGTSIPEIFTHIVSSLKILKTPENIETLSGIAIGTDLGSNIIQITIIVGIVGLMGVLKPTKKFMNTDYLIMIVGIMLLWFFSETGQLISRLEGVILAGSYIAYLYYLTKQEKVEDKFHHNKQYSPIISLLSMSFGFFVVLISADFILDAAILAADTYNISGSTIGALILGVCTALPELTTALIGIKRRAAGISVGTLIGSNITNPLFALGIGAAISTYTVDDTILAVDFPFWFTISVLGWIFFRSNLRVDKKEATILAFSYGIYVYMRTA
jgi:cation:H+ antiporter